MEQGLFKLVVMRYWKMIALVIVVILGVSIMETTTSLNSWQSGESYLQTKEAQDDFFELTLENGKEKYQYLDRETGKEEETQDFDVYRKDQLQFFNMETKGRSIQATSSKYYQENFLFYLAISASLGFMLFFYDLKSNFNTLLFSSRYSRKAIYCLKYIIVGGSFISTVLLGKIYALVTFKLAIPIEYFNGETTNLLSVTLASTCVIGLVFIASSFAGLILGEWLTAVLTLVGFGSTLFIFIRVLDEFAELFNYYVLGNKDFDKIIARPLDSLYVNGFQHGDIPPWYFVVYLIVAGLFLVSGYYLYQQLSLENNGQYLLFAQLKKPVLIIFIVYCVIIFGGLGSSIHLYTEYSEFKVWRIVVKAIFAAISSYLVGYFTIYRRFKIGKKTFFALNKVN